MIVLLASVIAATVCTAIYTIVIYWIDRYEKEPWWLLTATFLWGAVPSIIAALLINTGLSIPFYLLSEGVGDFVGAAVIAPFVEESLKGFALLGIFFLWRHELDSYLDGIIYAAMVGMGFALVENVFYFVSVFDQGGWNAWGGTVFLRAILFGLNHALFTSMTGLGLATARLSRNQTVRFVAPVVGWMVAVFLHALHNFSATVGGGMVLILFLSDFGGLLITILIIGWSIWQEGRWIQTYLQEEVRWGALTMQQYQRASSVWGRLTHDLNLLFSKGISSYWQGVQFYEKCAELAYKKHHYALFAHEEDLKRIERLRGEIAGISRTMI